MPDIAELLEQAAPRPTRDLPFASVQRRGRARTRRRAAAVGCSFAACLLVVAGLTRAVFEPPESESRVTTAPSSPDHGEDQADEDVHLDPTQQAQVDEVERLLQDEISPDALTNISASWIRPDGTVVVAFAGPNGAEEARRDPRLAALVAHPAVVLTEQRFTARDLDSVMRRAAEVLNRTVAGAPQATRDGWPWEGRVDARRNIVSIKIDRDLFKQHQREIHEALQPDVERGALVLDTKAPLRQRGFPEK